jgi:hypothetical protein
VEVNDLKKSFNVLLYPERFRSKGNALWMSALFPGAGQSYLTRGKPYWLLGIAGYGLAGFSIFTYTQYYDAVIHANNETQNAEKRQKYKEESDKKYTECLTYSLTTLIYWGANLVWVAIMPSDKQRFDSIQLKGQYLSNSNTAVIGIAYNF